jgi:hypothetical protein
VNWPPRSWIMNLNAAAPSPRCISIFRAAYVVQAPSGFALIPSR